jgi:hypothetical protein
MEWEVLTFTVPAARVGVSLLRGLDAWEALPWYVNVGQAGGIGWLVVYPLWCLWLGRVLQVRSEGA